MKRLRNYLLLTAASLLFTLNVGAQARRPIDSQHPMWMVHVDVWNSADPQKIIDLIPDDIKPYVCMNLSLSCQYDKDLNMYRMPRCAVRTYKSWASVCQQNGMWFTCQPASGGHTHIQDDDLETFEYFFKAYPNFLGWNYAEQFWGFDEAGDESSSTQVSRIALFAKLVPMHHKYGGVLTVSFCGNIWSHPLNPMGMMKRNADLLKACKEYPEAILWLYKYTTSSCFYNNESVTFGPFVSGLAKNYGVRYDNCGYNGALDAILGENHGKKYPGSAGIGTVMEQTCVNGGAVWDGPELIWTEDFQNLSNSTVDGYTRRNWGMYPNFRGVWIDMFRQIITGKMYIPTREEVVGNIKIVVQNDISATATGKSDEDKYAAWGNLYDGVYKQTDPFNRNNGQWMDNFWYLKSTGRYGTIPIIISQYDDVAKQIPVVVKKSTYTTRWSTIAKKTADFDKQYPEVSKGDLYVNRNRNQLVTYTPYTYLNKKKHASASIPLQYNTCDTLKLSYGKLSGGVIREYADHIDFYLNNYRSDSTTAQVDTILLTGVTAKPTSKLTKHSTGASGQSASITDTTYNAENGTYSIRVKHMGPLSLRVDCTGNADRSNAGESSPIAEPENLPTPQQPDPFVGPIVIEAENMDYKSVKNVALTHSGWCAPDYSEFAGMGYVEMGTNTAAALRHQLKLAEAGTYDIYIRYCNTTKVGSVKVAANSTSKTLTCEKVAKNDWHKLKLTANLKAGTNTLVITNTGGTGMTIDQIIYMPADMPAEKFLISVRQSEYGTVTPNVSEAAEGDTVTLTVDPIEGYRLKALRVINSVYYTMAKTIAVDEQDNITFVMPDDNVTLQPVFEDVTSVYKMDLVNALNGGMPEGWRVTQENNDIHEYPNSYTSGARIMAGFTGYQGKGLYWRKVKAEYGSQTAYPLNLEPGDYKLTYAMAAWQGQPKYRAIIVNAATENVVAKSAAYTASPNAGGNSSANLSSSKSRELSFTITEEGKYLIRFTNETNSGGLDEFLLLECRINKEIPDGIIKLVDTATQQESAIYDLSGIKRANLQRGLNIVRTADGKTRKILIK